MIAIGIFGLYEALMNPCATLRGSKRPLTKWRIFYGIFAAVGIGGGLLVFFGPF